MGALYGKHVRVRAGAVEPQRIDATAGVTGPPGCSLDVRLLGVEDVRRGAV